MEEPTSQHITARLALEWAQHADVQPAEWARRLCFVRGFARYRSATDPLTEIPPPQLLPHRSTRARPYLYTEEEVQRLLDAALELPTRWPSTPLRPWVFHCLIGLLSVTGLRISEALNLQLADVDLEQAVLTIRGAKLGRSRLVPIHRPRATSWPTTWSARAVPRRAPFALRLRLAPRQPARPRPRAPNVLRAVAPDGPARARREQGPTAARLPASLRRRGADALVSVGRGPGATAAGAVDLSSATSTWRARTGT